MIADVYTHEGRAKPLATKKPSKVSQRMRKLLPMLGEDKRISRITTGARTEFNHLEDGGIPREAVHRENKNDTAVVGRAMHVLKTDPTRIVADGDATGWAEAHPEVVDAYKKRPHNTLHGPRGTRAKEKTFVYCKTTPERVC